MAKLSWVVVQILFWRSHHEQEWDTHWGRLFSRDHRLDRVAGSAVRGGLAGNDPGRRLWRMVRDQGWAGVIETAADAARAGTADHRRQMRLARACRRRPRRPSQARLPVRLQLCVLSASVTDS